jgi:uncharacterized protein
MLTVASLHLHPVKSLGGFAVQEAQITDRGFAHDRRWMLVNEHGRFRTQREHPAMACLHTLPHAHGFRVMDVRDGTSIDLPWSLLMGDVQRATVWDDAVDVIGSPGDWSAWFTQRLGATVSLVFMPDASERPTDARYATGITSLSDGFPYLILSHASVDDLSARVGGTAALSLDRFRANIVIAGGTPYQEDGWKEITVGEARFSLVKPCARCAITTTDQRTGERGPEPLRTLATYRKRVTSEGSVKVDFGMNAMALAGTRITVGSEVHVIR